MPPAVRPSPARADPQGRAEPRLPEQRRADRLGLQRGRRLPAQFLIDDTEASVWSTKDGATPYNAGPHERVTIKLGQPGRITAIAVSALKSTTSSRFQALKDFALQTSSDGMTWTTAQKGGFTFQERRPTAPDLHLRTFKLAKPVQACYVRFFIDSVQGETQTRAQAAELHVFATSATTVTPSPPAPEQPFTDQGTITTGNPAAGDPTGAQNVFSVTGTEMSQTCSMPPASQGANGWVCRLPKRLATDAHRCGAGLGPDRRRGRRPRPVLPRQRVPADRLGGDGATDESTSIPGGTAYVLTQLWTGVNVPFTLTAKPAV